MPQLGDLILKAVRCSFPVGQAKRFFVPFKDLSRRLRNVGIDAQGEKFVRMQQLKVIGDTEDFRGLHDGGQRSRTTLEELLGSPAIEYGLLPKFLNREAELNPQPSQLQWVHPELTLFLFHGSPRIHLSPQNHPRLGWG